MEWMLETLDELPSEVAASIESDQFIDNVVGGIDIVTAYKRWVQKPFPDGHEGRDEIQVSCPTPSHRDRNPSASLNTEENVWVCYGCDARGDVLTMIGYWKGKDPRDKHDFMDLRKEICRDLGYEFYTTISGHEEILQTKPKAEVPTHDGGEMFDVEEAAAAGHFEKRTIEDLTQTHPFLLDTLDELGAGGPKLADGTDKKTAIFDRLKNKKGSDQQANPKNELPQVDSEQVSTPAEPEQAPDQPKQEEKAPEQLASPKNELPQVDSQPEPVKPKRKMPSFANLDRAADAIFGPGAEKAAQKPAASEPEPESTPSADGPRGPMDPGGPVFDWRNMVPENTPMHDYLMTVCEDDSPEEYHVANFLQFIGLLLGKDVHLNAGRKVYGNCMTCIVGRTGAGKSSSERYIDTLIERIMRFDVEDHLTKGVRVIRSAGSGPWISSLFNHIVEEEKPNPTGKGGPLKVKHANPGVRAIIRWPEMSTMLARGDNAEKIKATLQEIFDVAPSIGGGSLSNGEYRADNPFGSVATTTQTKMLSKIVGVNDVHSGLLNRFWFIIGNPKERQVWPKAIELEPLVPKVELIRKWAIEKSSGGSWHGVHEVVDRSVPNASGQVYEEFIASTIHPMMKLDNDMLQRVDLTFKKLVLLFSANMTENVVSVSAVEQAKAYFDYLIKCYEVVTEQLVNTDMSDQEQKVLDALEKYQGSKKFAETNRYPTMAWLHKTSLKGSIPERGVLVKIMKNLVEMGAVVSHKPNPDDKRSRSETYSLPNLIA